MDAAEPRNAACVPSSARDLDLAREKAEDALTEYARLAFGWNAPDDEHTRLSLQAMVQRVIHAYDDGSIRG